MAILVINGDLGDRGPNGPALQIGLLLQLVNEGLPGEDDALLVLIKLLRFVPGMKIEVILADNFAGVLQPQTQRHRIAAANKSRLDILEINSIRDVIQQRAQQVPLISQRFLGFLAVSHVPENSLNADEPAKRIVKGRLEHVDEEFFPAGRAMALDRVEVFQAAHDPQVVAVIFAGQFRWKKIEIGFAENFAQRFANQGAKPAIGESKTALHVLAENVLRQRLYQCLIKRFGGAEAILHVAMFLAGAGHFGQLAAQFQLGDYLAAENL